MAYKICCFLLHVFAIKLPIGGIKWCVMDSLIDKLLNLGSSFITLIDLEKLCKPSDYNEMVSIIRLLIEKGVIHPMGAANDTNGMIPPLRRRYRIFRPKEDYTGIRDEILRLGAEFNPSGYLARAPLYIKHRELLTALRAYIQKNADDLALPMSKNERAYAIWGNEKQLDDPLCKSMLNFINWENRLNYYHTPEPFFDYLCRGAETESVLALENKDIWFSLRKLFIENSHTKGFRLYGQFIDALVYGEGKKITRPGALESYVNGFCPSLRLYYWGDLDYEGISIFLNISLQNIAPFVPGYIAMLNYGDERRLTPCRSSQAPPAGINAFIRHFDSAAAGKIQSVLESGLYIPQEICGYPRLKSALEQVDD